MTMKQAYYDTQNKVAQAHIQAYDNSHWYYLWDVYSNYSEYKVQAYNRCIDLMNRLNGWGLRILSYNSNVFTVGFLFADPDTGVIRFAYITRDYDRFCDYI